MKSTIRMLALLLSIFAAFEARPAEKPNILLIVSDDHGYGDVGAYGCKDIPTPHLDSIAGNGVRFTSGYVTGPYCSPTRAGLLTGRYQTRFGHEFNTGAAPPTGEPIGLPLSETTLAQRLKDAGYRTGLVGKWHLGNDKPFHPLNRGFDEFFGFLGGSHSYVNLRPTAANPIMRGFEPVSETEYLTDAFGREALKFVDANKDQPWFLYLAFNAVHGPMDPAPRYADRFPGLSGGRKTYATMLTAMDDAIGALLARLRELNLEENTLVLFVADNGGPEAVNSSDNGPLRGVKAQTWEGGIRVPCMLQWKGKVPANQVFDHPVNQLDFAPTALAAAGVAVQQEWKMDGVDLAPFLTGKVSDAPHQALYWRFGQQMAVRKGDWKLVKASGAGLEETGGPLRRSVVTDLEGAHLYNLAEDIGETKNLAQQQPDKFQELAAAWHQWNEGNVPPKWYPGQAGGRKGKAKKKKNQ